MVSDIISNNLKEVKVNHCNYNINVNMNVVSSTGDAGDGGRS